MKLLLLVAAVIATVTGQPQARDRGENTAQLIRNATFIERTPEFTDLYIIHTHDKGRQIVIYCNASYCYKQVGHTVMV
jgi:hypothetical protein